MRRARNYIKVASAFMLLWIGMTNCSDAPTSPLARLRGAPDGSAALSSSHVENHLAFSTQPSPTAQSGTPFAQQPLIRIATGGGQTVRQGGVTITASIASGSGALGGTLTAVTDQFGNATFSSLSISGLGPHTIRFSAPGIGPVTSDTIDVRGLASVAIVTQPSATAQSGTALVRQPVVELRDNAGAPALKSGVAVSAAIASGGGTLTGTATVTTDASGVASFTNLAIEGTAGSYILSFGAPGLPATTSASVALSAGPARVVALVSQPGATLQSGAAFTPQPVLQLTDAWNNAVKQAGIPVSAGIATGTGGTLGGATTITTDVNGSAAFTNLTLSGNGTYTVQFAAPSLTPATSGTITVSAQTPTTTLAITTQPSTTVQSGQPFAQQPVVQLRDASGAVVSQRGVTVTAAIASGSGALGGALTASTNENGIARFAALSISGSGAHTLRFSAPGVTGIVSTSINVSVLSFVAITTQPSSTGQSGVALAQQPVVELRDGAGIALKRSGVPITAAIASGGGTLGGTVTIASDTNGVAKFSDLFLAGSIGSRTLSFSAASVPPATSNAIALTAGAASQVAIATQPGSSVQSGAAFAPQPVLQIMDAWDNAVSQSGVMVTATIATGSGGTLGGSSTTTTDANGTATFTNLSLSGSGAYTLQFGAPGLSPATCATITVTAQTPTNQVQLRRLPSTTAQPGVPFARQPSMRIVDANGVGVGLGGVTITASIASGTGTLGGTLKAVTSQFGVTEFVSLSITGSGPHTLRFSAPGITAAISPTIYIGTNGLAITTQPTASAQSGVSFTQQPVVALRDNTGAPITQSGVTITAAIASGGGTLGGSATATTDTNGVATFSNLSIAGTAGSHTLSFSSASFSSVTSSVIALGAGTAQQLSITTQPPATAQSGAAFAPQPVLQLMDAWNNAVSQSGVVVATTIATGSGGTLGGATTATTDASGKASFTNLSLAGNGSYSLQFSASGLTGAASSAIAVSAPSTTTDLAITAQPPATAQNGVLFSRQPILQLVDGSGNLVSQSGITVTVTVASGSGTIGGTVSVVTNANGTATYTNLSIAGNGAHTLRFSAPGITPVVSSVIDVSTPPPTANKLSIVTQPSLTATSGVPFTQQPVIQLKDASGNNVSQSGVSVTAAIASGGGTLGGTATIVTNANGTATFTNLSITGPSGQRSLSFSAASLASTTSTAISVSAPPPPPPGTGEPVFDPNTGVLVMQDNMDSYASATAMGAAPPGTSPRIVPIPSPVTTSTPVNNSTVVIVGRNGTGKALRMNYNGFVQQGADFETMNAPIKADTATYYFTYWARVTLSQPWTGAIAIKWFEAWHSGFDRVQWNTHDHLPCPTAHRATYWQVYDQGRETTCQGNQPVGPWWTDVTDGQWHRFTYAYRANTSRGSRDGFARMWIDGTKIIDISAATIGVTPPGGEKPWCLADDVDALAVNEGLVTVRWGGPQTSYSSPPWTYDVDDFMWWVKK